MPQIHVLALRPSASFCLVTFADLLTLLTLSLLIFIVGIIVFILWRFLGELNTISRCLQIVGVE